MKKIDSKWFDLIMSFNGMVEDVVALGVMISPSHKERERFLQNEVENPYFKMRAKEMPTMVMQMSARKKFLQAVLDRLEKEEKNEIIRDIYRDKVNRDIERTAMLEAAAMADDKTFVEYSKKIYGKPKKKFFKYIAKKIQQRISEVEKLDVDDVQKKAARKLKKVFGKIDVKNVADFSEMLPEVVKDDRYVQDAQDVEKIFQKSLKENGVKAWKLFVDESGERSTFSVSADKKIVNIPGTRRLLERKRPLTFASAEALAIHEIGVHALRAYNGSQQKLALLEFGLPGYLRGEEGVASYRQQRFEGATEYYGFDRYMAICLALGEDGEKRDFRSVFELVKNYYLITENFDKRAVERATDAAWILTSRIFRGLTGAGVGFAFTRDLVYLEGNIGIWDLVTSHPEVDQYFTLGKFDPLNENHINVLKSLEILPPELMI